jgi:hypothetical protein
MEGLVPFAVGPLLVVNFMEFLPRGITEHDGHIVDRKKSLIKVYTDPGGVRVLAAATIRFKDPSRELR